MVGEADEVARTPLFQCSVGHEIDPDRLEAETDVVRMDRGAQVRICKEHGAPIAVVLTAGLSLENHRPLL